MAKFNMKKKSLTPEQSKTLLEILKTRFEKNMSRHKGLKWEKIQSKLESNPEKLWSLNEMEETEGEPDVVDYNQKTDEYLFFDCSRKARNAEAFAMTTLPGNQERPTNRKATLLIKLQKWVLRF